jgi:hypothetical protein
VGTAPSPLGGTAIDRRPGSPREPFFTRGSTLFFSAVALTSLLVYVPLYGASDRGKGALGMLAALFIAVTTVVAILAWIGGLLLALRRGSLLGLLLVVAFPVLLGPAIVALLTPTEAEPPR